MFKNEIEINYLNVSEKLKQIFPHLDYVSIFYKSQNELKQIENGVSKEISSHLNYKLQTYRNQNLNYQWLLPSDIIEFNENEHTNVLQLDILSEYDNRMLVLNFKSEFDGLNDFVCLIFPKEIRFLGLYKTTKNLTTDDKILIGELVHKLIEVEINTSKDFLKKQNRLSEYLKLKEVNRINFSSESYFNYIESELKMGLNIILNTKIDFFFNRELIDYLVYKNYSIKKACQYLSETYYTIHTIEEINNEFEFQLIHFKLIENEKSNLNHSNDLPFTNQDKVIELLDKLETAAKLIESKGLVINGKLIAQYSLPPVSPPAITDILKKNINKIETKLKESPERWLLIRKYLKPLRELEFKLQINRYNQKIG